MLTIDINDIKAMNSMLLIYSLTKIIVFILNTWLYLKKQKVICIDCREYNTFMIK